MARFISAEEVLSALIDTLVNPVLAKIPPFGGVKAAEPNISSQMEAVAWLYNRYLGKELPHLEALDWENICIISCRKQTRLSKFMGPSAFSAAQGLSLTEQKIKSACEVVASLRSPGNIRGTRTTTKVCVCLLNYRQDKCVLVLGAATVGVWSFIEKRRHLQCIKETSEAVLLSDEELAFQAVEEHTGIKPTFLQLQCSFLINDDLSGSGGSTKFYIMSCSGTFDLSCFIKVKRIAWVSIDNVLPKAHEPLIDALDQIVRSTPAVSYFHLRPFCSSLENWLTKNRKVNVWNFKHAVEANLERQFEKSVSKFGRPQLELNNEELHLLKSNTEMSNTSTHIGVPSNWRPQVLTEPKVNTDLLISSNEETRAAHCGLFQKLEEEKQQLIDLKVNTVAMEGQLSIGSPQSSTLLTNIPGPSLRNGRCINDVANVASKHCEDKLRQMHQAVDEVALSLNTSRPNDRLHVTLTKTREEVHILDKAGELLSLKTAYRTVRKRRKTLSKELRDHTQQMDELYKQIAECDSHLATLIGGGKGAQQLAVELCKKDPEKPMSLSDVSIHHSHTTAMANSMQADRPRTINKNKTFCMLKSSIQELNEICTKNSWTMPSYGVFMHKNIHGENIFSGKVRIRNSTFELSESGEASPSSKKAKLSAAAYMLSALHRLKACNGTM